MIAPRHEHFSLLWAGILLASMLRDTMAQCGSRCGLTNGFPVFSVIRFNLDNCDLYRSWNMVQCSDDRSSTSCSGLRDVDRFSSDQAGNNCDDNFTWIHFENHRNWHFNSLVLQLNDANTCSGEYELDFDSYSDDYSNTFHDAKVLCHNDEILAILALDPHESADYQLYYETDANYLIEYGSLFEGTPRVDGQYCKALFPLMTDLLRGLKQSSTFFESLPSACVGGGDSGSDSSSTAIIVGAAAGGAVLLALLIGFVVFLSRRKKNTKDSAAKNKAQVGANPEPNEEQYHVVEQVKNPDEEECHIVEQVKEVVSPDGSRTVVTRTVYTGAEV